MTTLAKRIKTMNTAEMNRFPVKTEWTYSWEAIKAARNIPQGTVSEQSHAIGMRDGEPLLIALDAAHQYASTYAARFGSKLASDYVLGDHWLEWVKAIRGLLNGDGAIAMQLDRSTDSKDNSAMEELFWSAMDLAGFTEKDL